MSKQFFYLAYPIRYAVRTDLTWTENIIGVWSVVMSITIDVLEFFRLFLLLIAEHGKDPSEFANSAKNH